MLLKNRKILLSLILISLLSIKCDNKYNCDFAFCTEEFKSIVLIIQYSADHSPYLLSDYKVIRLSDNKDITPTDDRFLTSKGYYQIANDIKKNLFKFKNVKVEFKGYLNNDLVIQRQFTITADCCHVSLIEGNTLILL
jgi:hypothetical protein